MRIEGSEKKCLRLVGLHSNAERVNLLAISALVAPFTVVCTKRERQERTTCKDRRELHANV